MKRTVQTLLTFFSVFAAQSANGQEPGWFTKVSSQMGWDVPGAFTFSVADVNNDDYPDVIVLQIPPGETVYTVRKPLRIFLNVKDPSSSSPNDRKFVDVTAQTQVNIVPPDTGNHANCYTLADFNNDGNLDLVTGNFFYRIEGYTLPNDRPQVFLGDGTGNFIWHPNNGLQDLPLINIRTLTALDYDLDGNLDLFIATWFKDYTNNVWDHSYLMKGNGDGTFTNVTAGSGLENYLEPMYSASAIDWNNDCYPDVISAPYCRTGGKLFKNEGNGHFTNMATAAGYNLYRTGSGQAACTFTVVPEDVNNDGYMDAFIAVVHGGNAPGQFRSTIAINKGPQEDYRFEIDPDLLPVNAPASSHRGDYDGCFLDFDNDGLKDLVMAQATYQPATDRTYFWKQQPDHTFEDVTGALGLLVPDLKGSAVVKALDFDLDGDDDLMVLGAGGNYFDIWRNNVGSNRNWVAVKLWVDKDKGINRSAIGARAYVYYEGKMQMKEVKAGRGMHTAQESFILNFGLGDATRIDSIVIRWPGKDCPTKTFYSPPMGRKLTLTSFPVDVAEMEQPRPEIKVFPNPTTDYLIVQRAGLVDEVRGVAVTDVTGRSVKVIHSNSDGDKLVFSFAGIPDGVYFVQLSFDNARTSTYKIVKDSRY